MKHKLNRRVRSLAQNRPSKAAVIIRADDSQHERKVRTGKNAPITFSVRPEWQPEKEARWAELGDGATELQRKLKMLNLPDYEQAVLDENGKLRRPKWEPIVNELGNQPDVGAVEANVQANETMPYNHYAREFIWPNQES